MSGTNGKRLLELAHHIRLVRLVGMQFKAIGRKADFREPLVDNIQRGLLLRDEKNTLSKRKIVRNDI